MQSVRTWLQDMRLKFVIMDDWVMVSRITSVLDDDEGQVANRYYNLDYMLENICPKIHYDHFSQLVQEKIAGERSWDDFLDEEFYS